MQGSGWHLDRVESRHPPSSHCKQRHGSRDDSAITRKEKRSVTRPTSEWDTETGRGRRKSRSPAQIRHKRLDLSRRHVDRTERANHGPGHYYAEACALSSRDTPHGFGQRQCGLIRTYLVACFPLVPPEKILAGSSLRSTRIEEGSQPTGGSGIDLGLDSARVRGCPKSELLLPCAARPCVAWHVDVGLQLGSSGLRLPRTFTHSATLPLCLLVSRPFVSSQYGRSCFPVLVTGKLRLIGEKDPSAPPLAFSSSSPLSSTIVMLQFLNSAWPPDRQRTLSLVAASRTSNTVPESRRLVIPCFVIRRLLSLSASPVPTHSILPPTPTPTRPPTIPVDFPYSVPNPVPLPSGVLLVITSGGTTVNHNPILTTTGPVLLFDPVTCSGAAFDCFQSP